MTAVLSDLTIIEYGDFISAPFCSKLMADLGATVIKVEPLAGDSARRHGPFPNDAPHPERSGLYLNLNTNKLGITLDTETETGKKLFYRLVAQADIVVENFAPRELADRGLDYEHLREVNPRLIVTSVTPFGQTGPYKDYKGYAINAAALGGMSNIVGEPGREPLTPPMSLGHYQGGAVAAFATLAAAFARDANGEGQHVDVSEAEVWATLHVGYLMSGYVYHGMQRMRSGHRTPGIYPYTILPCKDGFMSMIAIQGFQWKRFLELVGDGAVPEWYAKEPRFQDRYEIGRKYAAEMDELLAPWLSAHTKAEIFAACREQHIPFAPVRSIDEVANDEHLGERQFFTEITHPEAGTLRYPGAPYRFSETPWALNRPAPLLGEHNAEIYCGRLGCTSEELVKLRQTGII
ncbi:MAG: CoA transferase [Chloroflexota bacterium]|nr:MAG: CoA transferase [Chloroflexota bacterium]